MYRFVDGRVVLTAPVCMCVFRGAAVDVKNKKGNTPLWLACNGWSLGLDDDIRVSVTL